MRSEEILKRLTDKDDKAAYAFSKEIGTKSAANDEYYGLFDVFASLLSAKSSYVRTRGFVLCCAQARWDKQGKLQEALSDMLKLLHDEKPTVVRQCLSALHEVVLYRPELCERIVHEVNTIDFTKYKDSMSPLVEKDIGELMELKESRI